MSERCFRLPLDFESRPWFRVLAGRAAGEASGKVVSLFRELGYAAETEKLGFLPEAMGPNVDAGLLEMCGLLQRVENPNGWQCDVFARLNPELDGEYMSEARKGGYARAVSIAHRKAKEEALLESGAQEMQGLFANMEAPSVNGALALVKATDNVYRRAARKPMEWSEGLLSDARRAREKYSDEVIDRTLTWVYGRVRDARMAGVPKNTEELLRDFESYVAKG